MTRPYQKWIATATLVFLALLSGIAWRAELEWRWGWMSLGWLSSFHWAVPICALAFIVWVVCLSQARRPFLFAAVLIAFACAAYLAVFAELMFLFGRGGKPLALLAALPFLWSLLPFCFLGVCRLFGARPKLGLMLLSAALFTASWPIATLICSLMHPIDVFADPCLIHALKSGYIIPILVIALGIPLLFPRPAHESACA